jgi:hypothetical protein
MKVKPLVLTIFSIGIFSFSFSSCIKSIETKPYRIIVSTDIGGTDFDDYQSMVHLLLYADTLDIEGIISSPFGEGRKKHILEAIDAYELDFPKLRSYSDKYPSADTLRKLVKQGAIDSPGPVGYSHPTEGSDWIIECARKKDSRPLNVLIWGGIEDLAQALHDAPDILPKIRVYFIGGPNKKWSVDAYQYIADHFPNLWIIESNATYRGWFVGGIQEGIWSNTEFVDTCIKNFGALGSYFYSKGKSMKMGDTPSLAYFLNGDPDDPKHPGWGGQYVRAWNRPHKIFNRLTTDRDSIEQFGVMELLLRYDSILTKNPYAELIIDRPLRAQIHNGIVRFLFSPKSPSKYNYTISSNITSLDKLAGCIISYKTPASNISKPSSEYPNWWTDNPSPEFSEGEHIGVKTVNQWRKEFLSSFARRMRRCESFNPLQR